MVETKYVLPDINAGQRTALNSLIAEMRAGTARTTVIYNNGEAHYGLKAGSHRALANLRFGDQGGGWNRVLRGITRAEVGNILAAELATINVVGKAPVEVVHDRLVLADITVAQRTSLEALIVGMKNEYKGSTHVQGNEGIYGLVSTAGATLRSRRLNAPYLTRKQMGYLLSEQLTAVLAAQPAVAGTPAKRPQSFTFRKLTAERISNVRRLIKDMKAGIAGTSDIRQNGRLTYGLTALAVEKMVSMRVNQDKSRAEVGAWLSSQYDKALRDQEAVAQRAGNGRRRVSFR